MNFLLHQHLAVRDLGSRRAGLGAMLPDLWRMADRRVRPLRKKPVVQAAWDPLLAGVHHHLAVDRWFHRDRIFLHGEALAREQFRQARLTAPKTFFLAHIAWELALDGALVRHRKASTVVADLTASLGELEPQTLDHFATAAARPLDDIDRTPFEQRMQQLWGRLLESDWIPGYAHGPGLAARVLGVRRRLGLPSSDPAEEQRLGAACEELLTRATETLPTILAAPPQLSDSLIS